jgi:hypothetical protein
MEQPSSHWTNFHKIWVFFEILWRKFYSDCTTAPCNTIAALTHFLTTSCVCWPVQYIFPCSHVVYEKVEKYGSAGQATYDNIMHRMRLACLINKVANTHRMCNTCYFSTATVVTRTRLMLRLCVHCLSCLPLDTQLPDFVDGDTTLPLGAVTVYHSARCGILEDSNLDSKSY